MIVLSVGMPRAGSGWHYNLIRDLMATTGCADTAFIRSRYRLQNVLTEVNCNIGVLSARRVARVAVPALLGNTFVIKAHSRPTTAFRVLRMVGLVRATYIYRDPRDAMLSAMEYGRRGLEAGRRNAFSDYVEFEQALGFMNGYVQIWSQWSREAGVLSSRYEDLLTNYGIEARRLAAFLGVDENAGAVTEVIRRYQPAAAESRQGTHFSKGRIGRFRETFTPEQQLALTRQFEPYLRSMGYST
jgi:hypothetical protein